MAKLDSIIRALRADPGLRDGTTDREMNRGIKAVELLNATLMTAINRTGVNDDRLLTPGDMARISAYIDRDANALLLKRFLDGHGNDNGTVESGYHHLQDDGGSLTFRGRNFADTVADAIYHYGFKVEGGRFVNEDGASNETTADVAGWLNYFLNARSVVWGGKDDDGLWTSDDYSRVFASARNETFYAGAGDDSIGSGLGNDRIYGGSGNDQSGGGKGNDRMYGETGRDSLWGDEGRDAIYGGAGDDVLGGRDDGDRLFGGTGADTLYGDAGRDRLDGGADRDQLMGGMGNDRLSGGSGADALSGNEDDDAIFGDRGNDTMSGNDGRDTLNGGRGADTFEMWDDAGARDVVRIERRDTGNAAGTWDVVRGFEDGVDKVDLRGFGDMRFRDDPDYAGGGRASCYYVEGDGGGASFLFIDANGDRATDAKIAFDGWQDLGRGDLILG